MKDIEDRKRKNEEEYQGPRENRKQRRAKRGIEKGYSNTERVFLVWMDFMSNVF